MMQKTLRIVLIITACNSLSLLFGQQRNPPSNKFTYKGCGCDGSIDLEIYNGQEGVYGGQMIDEQDEASMGAVTITNKNDTDGDTKDDWEDNDVSATPQGRDEVDLMRLIIVKTGTFSPNCKILRLETSGKIKIWKYATKKSLASLYFDLSTMEENTTLWIEAYEKSDDVRDISVKAVLSFDQEGVQVDDVVDEVKATAIWVELVQKHTTRSSSPSTSSLLLDEPCLEHLVNNVYISTDGTKYGLGENTYFVEPPNVSGPCGIKEWENSTCTSNYNVYTGLDGTYGGRILIEFILKPEAIKNELSKLGIKFDVTRQIIGTTYNFNYLSTMWNVYSNLLEPSSVELPTDDKNSYDEDNNPSNGKLFSWDNPSNVHYMSSYFGSQFAFMKRDLKFNEFVRVSFKTSISPSIEKVEGSRSSYYVPWEMQYYLKSSNIPNTNGNLICNQYLSEFTGNRNVSYPRNSKTGSDSNGNINPTLLVSASTCGYLLQYNIADYSWKLTRRESNGNIVVGSFLPIPLSNPKEWNCIDSDKVMIHIKEGTIQFLKDDVYLFNVLIENPIYNFK